jgi:copper chaperone CopZ
MSRITYKVPNISCGHCVHTIQNELGELAGVLSVNANQGTKLVTVEYDAPASPDTIEALLAEINYPPEKPITL